MCGGVLFALCMILFFSGIICLVFWQTKYYNVSPVIISDVLVLVSLTKAYVIILQPCSYGPVA